jgi:hypothetical protein
MKGNLRMVAMAFLFFGIHLIFGIVEERTEFPGLTLSGREEINKAAPLEGFHYVELAFAADEIEVPDSRMKNVTLLQGGLDKVSALRGIRFEWRIDEFPDRVPQSRGAKIGLIPQEVEKVLPEVVAPDSFGTKAVDYGQMVPVLIEAVKELNQENQRLKARVEALERLKR